MAELLLSLRQDGANPNFDLPQPLSYQDQIKLLEGAGLVTPIITTPKSKASISKANKDKVKIICNKISLKHVYVI